MHNSLKVLLEKASNDVSKKHKEEQHKTGIILGFSKGDSEEQFLLYQIRRIKSFVQEILISVPNNWVNENQVLEKECDTFPIKLIERSTTDKQISLPVFDSLIKHSLNDNILFLSNNHNLSRDKVAKLLIQELPICTFLGQKGNILSSIGFYNRWINRFMIQILMLNNRYKIINLFRISNSKLFLKIAKTDSIQEWVDTTNNFRKIEDNEAKSVYVPLKLHFEIFFSFLH